MESPWLECKTDTDKHFRVKISSSADGLRYAANIQWDGAPTPEEKKIGEEAIQWIVKQVAGPNFKTKIGYSKSEANDKATVAQFLTTGKIPD